MDNQHRMIAGYRELSEVDIKMMNDAKQLQVDLNELCQRIAELIAVQAADPEQIGRHQITQPARWLAIGRTNVQLGMMALVRAIAQPAL